MVKRRKREGEGHDGGLRAGGGYFIQKIWALRRITWAWSSSEEMSEHKYLDGKEWRMNEMMEGEIYTCQGVTDIEKVK